MKVQRTDNQIVDAVCFDPNVDPLPPGVIEYRVMRRSASLADVPELVEGARVFRLRTGRNWGDTKETPLAPGDIIVNPGTAYPTVYPRSSFDRAYRILPETAVQE